MKFMLRFSARAFCAVCVLLAGCAGPRQAPPPPATEAQIGKEREYLQKNFLIDPCLTRLRKAAHELAPTEKQAGRTLYAVEFPAGSIEGDGRAYQLHVKDRERTGYLYVSNSTAGWYSVYGPMPLWQCLHDTMSR